MNIEKVRILPAPMPLSRILEIYDNLPEKAKASFVEQSIDPTDQDTVKEAIIEHERTKQYQELVKSIIKALEPYKNTTAAKWEDDWEHIVNIACKLLLELTDYNLKDTHDVLAVYIHTNCPIRPEPAKG